MQALNNLSSYTGIYENPKNFPINSPPFYQNATYMRPIGATALVSGVAAMTIAGMEIYNNPLSSINTISDCLPSFLMGVGALVSYVGSKYLFGSYWEDPKEVEDIRKYALQLSFSQIIQKYGFEKATSDVFITKAELKEKFFKEMQTHPFPYNTTCKLYLKDAIKCHFLDKADLHHLLLQDIEHIQNYAEFQKLYKTQPFLDHIISIDHPVIQKLFLNSIRQLPMTEILQNYSRELEMGILSNLQLNQLFEGQLACKTLSEFIHFHSSLGFQYILDKGWLQPDGQLRDKAFEETTNLSVLEIRNQFGWVLFQDKILPLNLLHEKMESEVKSLSFDEIIDRYGWMPFKLNLISLECSFISRPFKNLFYSCSFVRLYEKYGQNLINSGLFPENIRLQVADLIDQYEEAVYDYNQQEQCILQLYNSLENQAKIEKQEKLSQAALQISEVELEITRAESRYSQAMREIKQQYQTNSYYADEAYYNRSFIPGVRWIFDILRNNSDYSNALKEVEQQYELERQLLDNKKQNSLQNFKNLKQAAIDLYEAKILQAKNEFDQRHLNNIHKKNAVIDALNERFLYLLSE